MHGLDERPVATLAAKRRCLCLAYGMVYDPLRHWRPLRPYLGWRGWVWTDRDGMVNAFERDPRHGAGDRRWRGSRVRLLHVDP